MTDMTLVKFEDDSCQPFRDLGAFRGEFNNFIFAFLPLLSPKSRRLLLAGLDHKILPNMSQPHLMSNYLFETFKIGGPTSILCLNGLFTLIREYNLDFPDFYDCLYSLLDGATFSCKYRVMFLDHLKLFLSSTMIPAYIIAGFLKKSCRLALASPTSMSAWVIPFTYNMLLVHPACRVLIHREMTESWTDPFDPNEKSLRLCRALESSLWEIKALDSHFWPRIAKLSSILRDRFVRPPFDLASIAMDIEGSLSAEEAQKELSHTWSKSPPLGLEISANFFEF